jgi:hemolysin activation/secretion protein
MHRSPARPGNRIEHVLGLVVGATLIPAVALAQGLPGSIDPGRLPERFRPPPGPAPTPEIITPELPGAAAPAEALQIKLALRQVVVAGSTVYSEAQLRPLYADLLGKTISLAEIYRLADAITTKYRSDGFILSRAVVEAQRIVEGSVRIRVIEGFVDHVTIQGDRDAAMDGYGGRIVGSRPLKAADLERYLLLMNDLPGVSASGVLSPAEGVVGGSELTVVVERKTEDATVSLDNRGTKYSGPLQLFTEAGVNNPFGLADRLAFQYITTPASEQELRYFGLSYAVPIGSNGAKFSLATYGSEAVPGSTLQTAFLRTETSGETVTARLSQPFIRSREQNLIGDVSFTLRNSITDQFSLPSETRLVSSYDDRIRVFRAGASYDTKDSWSGSDFVRLEMSQGVPIFDASKDGALTDVSRPGGRTMFTKGTLDASRLQSLATVTPGLNVLTAMSAGWSFGQSLLASEQFGVGGSQFGRGYDPSELTGDYGAAAKLEIQYDVRPEYLDALKATHLSSLQFFTFCDYGVVSDQNPQLLNETHATRSLTSTGFGLRTNWTSSLSASLEVDKPLTRDVAAFAGTSDPDPFRIYFTLVARF